MPHFLSAALRDSDRYVLTISRTGATLADRIEIAGHSEARRRGLLGRDSLDHGSAFVIAPCQGVHTFGMRFALDIVAVTRDGEVIKIRTRVPRNRIVLAWSGFAMIELPAGTLERSPLQVGDLILARSITSSERI